MEPSLPQGDRQLVVRYADFTDPYSIGLWKNYFPNPRKSPGPRTLRLSIGAATLDALRWIHSFNHLEELSVNDGQWEGLSKPIFLAQLHGLSHTLKTLRIVRHSVSLSEVCDFIFSFPNLENLRLDVHIPFENDTHLPTTPSAEIANGGPDPLLRLTGSLALNTEKNCGIGSIVTKLLTIPGGLHFSNIKIASPVLTDESATKLVSSCSGTLKSLHIEYTADPVILLDSPRILDLSNATELESVEFRWNRPEVKWIAETLKTITRNRTLRRVTISLNPNFILSVPIKEWHDLDLTLLELRSENPVIIMISCSDRLRAHVSTFLSVSRAFHSVFHTDDHPFRNDYDLDRLKHWTLT